MSEKDDHGVLLPASGPMMLRIARCLAAALCMAGLLAGAPVPGFPAPQAKLATAVDAYARGDLAGARGLLEPLLQEPGVTGGRAAYLLGVVDLLEKRFPQAGTAFGLAAGSLPVLADHALYYQAVAAFDGGQFAHAAEMFREVAARFPHSTLRGLALFWGAESLWGARSPQAPDAFHEYLAAFGNGRHAPQAWFDMGMALEQQGRWGDAVQAYRRIRWVFEGSRYAAPAGARLASLAAAHTLPPDVTPPEAFYQRAVADLDAGHSAAAQAGFRRVLSMPRGWVVADGARYSLGVIAYQAHRLDEAETDFRRDANLRQAHADDALYYLVRIALAKGREADALQTARALAQAYPGSSLAPRGLYIVAAAREDRGALGPAAALFREAAGRFPGTRWGSRALWELGWIQYRTRQWQLARASWLRLVKEAPDAEIAAAGGYWAARVASSTGRAGTAKDEYRQTVTLYPDTYYGQQAASLLGVPVRVAIAPPLSEVPDGQVAFLDRYRELDALAQPEDATRELEAAAEAAPPRSRDQIGLLLSERYEQQDQVSQGILEAEQVRASDPPSSGRNLPLALWEALYPQANWPTITQAAGRAGVDPYLVAGVIREESRFDPRAVSPAGAYGLMQLLPGTARSAARNTGVPAPDARGLADPKTNILLGSVVLAELLHQFGRADLAVAAYNAGPEAVRRWQAERPGLDPASFVEEIPYAETRAYVKAVLESTAIYRWLYRDGHPSGP